MYNPNQFKTFEEFEKAFKQDNGKFKISINKYLRFSIEKSHDDWIIFRYRLGKDCTLSVVDAKKGGRLKFGTAEKAIEHMFDHKIWLN